MQTTNKNRQSHRNKSLGTSDFYEKFKGKITLMGKEGHMGVVVNTRSPIKKIERPLSNVSLDNLPRYHLPTLPVKGKINSIPPGKGRSIICRGLRYS